MNNLFSQIQKLAPQHGLSRFAGQLASSRTSWLKKLLIEQFARVYQVDLTEAERPHLDQYTTFNDFFTRALKSDARPLDSASDSLLSPADGAISQLGKINASQLLQAKGHTYSITSLAGELAQGFDEGTFCTIYLAPKDYHRVHLPVAGTLMSTLAIPGALFSVNNNTEENIPGLFARNERLVCRFETAFGPMLIVLVGAMIVASITTDWEGPHSPYHEEMRNDYHLVYERGDEIGRFLLGSTVICCFPPGSVALDANLQAGDTVRMGQSLGQILSA